MGRVLTTRFYLRGHLKSYLFDIRVLDFAPPAPQLAHSLADFQSAGSLVNSGGRTVKSPPSLGDLGGFYVANETF